MVGTGRWIVEVSPACRQFLASRKQVEAHAGPLYAMPRPLFLFFCVKSFYLAQEPPVWDAARRLAGH